MGKTIHLRFLGPIRIEQAGETALDLKSRKAMALLGYLAAHSQAAPRERLVDLLWGDKPEARGRANLSWVLHRISNRLPGCLEADRHSVRFQRAPPGGRVEPAVYRLDTDAFAALEAQGDVASLTAAVALYRGEFLEGLYLEGCPELEIWLVAERERWRQRAAWALGELVVHYSRQGAPDEALRFARRLLALEPWREEMHQQVMRLLAQAGQRGAALAQYEACRRALATELDVKVDERTTALYERIKAGELAPPSPHAPAPVSYLSLERDNLSPFVVGPPITAPSQFFGREGELQFIFGLWRRFPLQHVAVTGPQRSGKTSLLHYVERITGAGPVSLRPGQRNDWLPEAAQYRWLFVDFRDARMGQQERLLCHLLAGLGMPAPRPCSIEIFMDVASRHLTRPAVILMDEIGAGLASEELDQPFWWSLRSLVCHYSGGNLAFLLTSRLPPAQLAQDYGKPSPFFNIFHALELGPLTMAEARQLIDTSPRPFPPADVAWILDQSGRWPSLLQILCQTRLGALEAGRRDEQWREDGLRQIAPFRHLLSTDSSG